LNSHNLIPLCEPLFRGREKEYLANCIDSGWVSSAGQYVRQLEEGFEKILPGCRAAAVSSGTAAMFLALRGLRVPPDSEVIVQDVTFAGTVNPVIHLGARPLFMDIDESTLSLDPEKLDDFFRNRIIRRNGINYNRESGRAVAAVIAAHLYGLPARIEEIAGICSRYGVPLIEDAAESLGATWEDRPTGTFGQVAIFSLNGNKLVTGGSGGIVVASDARLIQEVKRWSDHYRSEEDRWVYERAGYNYQLNNLQAAVALAQLEQLPQKIARKRQVHDLYAELFQQVPEVSLLEEVFPGRASYWINVIQIENSDVTDVIAELASGGIEARPVFKPLHTMKPYQDYLMLEPLSGTEYSSSCCCLPSSENLTTSQQEQVVERVIAAVRYGTKQRRGEHV
jgi:perosamine synthetase